MPNRKRVSGSRYQQVSVAIAKRIVSGEFKVGEKISSRTTLSSLFGVSSETTRKALNILADLRIVSLKHGSGAVILSKEKAAEFVENYEAATSLNLQKYEIIQNITVQEQALKDLRKQISTYLNRMQIINDRYPLEPYALPIDVENELTGHELKDIDFWAHTGATLVAIERGGDLLISPSPYQTLEKGDLVYFVGEEESYQRAKKFFDGP